jgi:hypothetical protein
LRPREGVSILSTLGTTADAIGHLTFLIRGLRMRLHYFDARRATVSRLAAATLCALALSCAGAAWFAARSFHDPLTDAPPEDVRAWRPPTFSLETPNGSTRARADEATLARPLFLKSRRPFGGPNRPAAPDSAAAPPPPGLSLRAVVRFGGKTRVFIVSPAFPEGKWFEVGETLEGWTIKEARQDIVTLRNGERATQLEFNYDDQRRNDAPLPPPPAFEAPPPSNAIRKKGERST